MFERIKSYERQVHSMKERTTFNNLGQVNLAGISVEDGRIELHLPIAETAEPLEKILDFCTGDYIKKHTDIDSYKELNYDVRMALSWGGSNVENEREIEISLFIIVWQSTDEKTGEDTAEFYGDMPVALDEEDTEKIKAIARDILHKTFSV